MTSTHFLIKQKSIQSSKAVLEGKEHHHLSKVLRIKPGKRIWLIDGQGQRYFAEVKEIRKHETRLDILEKAEKTEQNIHLSLAQALLKSKKMDFLIQKATELGVDCFLPLTASRSVVRIRENEANKLERWQKIAAEAAKQSQRSYVPAIRPPQPFRLFIEGRNEARKLLLSESRGKYLREILAEGVEIRRAGPNPSVVIAVGPEGGWTNDEERSALDRGFESVSLGKQILRSETAALAALAIISHFWNL